MIFEILFAILKGVLLLAFVSLTTMFLVYLERKISGHFQVRFGPMRVGFHGSFQLFADMFKLLMKEDIIPTLCDKWVFMIAPVMIFIPAYLLFTIIPIAPGFVIQTLDVGLLYLLGITGLTVLAIMMAGWSSNNKYALIGGFRSVAQIISYEVPLVLSLLPVIMIADSFSLTKIVEAQGALPFIFIQPLAFFIYFTASIAEINRAPFDMPEAESELVSGYNVEYSGMRFAIFFFAEYMNMFAVCAIATVLFLGGWHGPILPPAVWFFLKSYFLVFILMWIRWTFPRLRVDQLMGFCWKRLFPLAIINLIITAIWMGLHG